MACEICHSKGFVAIVASLAAAVVIVIIYFLKKNGVFKKAKVQDKVIGPYLVVYKNNVGAYAKICGVFQEVQRLCSSMGWDEKRGKMCGVYYDNPHEVESSKCRCSVGAVWAENKTMDELQKMKQELQAFAPFQKTGLQVAIFPRSETYAVEFPFCSMMSLMIGIHRAYIILKKHLEKQEPIKNCSSFELYDSEKEVFYVTFPTTARTDLLPFSR
eukprot:TRINITY_DN2697_c0_g1_i4.p3 TRINITY_DN2697_c0_g1~~TRINITY_DN2697_c0_g1_i4.p3  ORF type:complete len:215 (-),score=16.38 TRINITY_DN2697_c0_g1_i4:221-865(-)